MRLPSGGSTSESGTSLSLTFPNPVRLGVPSSLIDSFQMPPFLLPIYQAAGIEYDVPWQVLAAINWIESDYGRDLAVSSAGAVGWMQFLPSTWRLYGVDATGSGYADPYNPTDAIFSAARYLAAAGAATNLSRAIFAYNHANWYVESVLLRAQLIGGMPASLLGALTGLVQGHFPVAARSRYVEAAPAATATAGAWTAADGPSPSAPAATIYAHAGAPVVAVSDGKIVAIGDSPTLGRYIELQDATGNTYTYAGLGSIPALYPVPRPVRVTATEIATELLVPDSRPARAGVASAGASAPAPKVSQPASAGAPLSQPASAGNHATALLASADRSKRAASRGTSTSTSASTYVPVSSGARHSGGTDAAGGAGALVKERLFADPSRPGSFAAGGAQQVGGISSVDNYFSDVLHLNRNQYTLEPLQVGAIVVAGTIIGRVGVRTPAAPSHLRFMIEPAGRGAPYIDPKPILDGWRLLQATAAYRAAGLNPFLPGNRTATIGQILLESKQQLEARVLGDPHVRIYACGRRDIEAGQIDQRILATIEFLSESGLAPTVSGLACGAGQAGIDAAGSSGASVDISAINGIPIAGHQGRGTITDLTIRRLLTLQGALAPTRIISLMSYRGEPSTLALPDHRNRIQISYATTYGRNHAAATAVKAFLAPQQWLRLVRHLSTIREPTVPTVRSRYAIRTRKG